MTTETEDQTPQALAFTGERFMPDVSGNILLEHLHRYLQACELVDGKVVLDIACGEGYGSSMLADRAAAVTGVDISGEAVQHARTKYQKGNLSYLEGDCAAIPLAAASVDIVVSFETIEHHDQHEEMMQEIKRVLRPGGVLVISSPDKRYYSDEPGLSNPFHVKELYEGEFKELLQRHFRHTTYFGQRIVYGSAIFPEQTPASISNYTTVQGNIENTLGITRPTYWIALASDNEVPTPSCGIFDQPVDESEAVSVWKNSVAERDWRIGKLDETVDEYKQITAHRDQDIAVLNEEVGKRDRIIAELRARTSALQVDVSALQESNSTLQASVHATEQRIMQQELGYQQQLEELYASKSWRVTKPLRDVTTLIRRLLKKEK